MGGSRRCARPWWPCVAVLLGAALCLPAAAAREHRRHHRARAIPHNPQVNSRLAGRHLQRRTARQRRALLGRDPEPVLRTGRRPSQLGLHPVHRQAHDRSAARVETPVGELKTVRVDLPVGLSVNPGATAAARWPPSKPAPAAVPPARRSAKATSRPRWPGVRRRRPRRVTEVPVYNVDPETGRAGALRPRTRRQRSLPRRRRRLGRRLPRGIHDPRPARAEASDPLGSKGVVLKNRLVFNGRSGDGTFITTPSTCLGEACATASPSSVYSTFLLASSYEPKRKARATHFPQSADRRSSRRSRRAPRRKNATRSPTTRPSARPQHRADRLALRRRRSTSTSRT